MTQAWLRRHGFVYKLLPTQSPQFNAIEQCWSWIKQWTKECAPDSLIRLEADLDAACTALPQSVIDAALRNAQKHVREYASSQQSL